jgi:hypothetical protein
LESKNPHSATPHTVKDTAHQQLFFTPVGGGAARPYWRNKDIWGDIVSPSRSLRKLSY